LFDIFNQIKYANEELQAVVLAKAKEKKNKKNKKHTHHFHKSRQYFKGTRLDDPERSKSECF